MKCPNCGEAAAPDHDDRLYCVSCGLAGPREVRDELAARLAPAGVLAEAERLLRERGASEVTLSYGDEWPGMRHGVCLVGRVGSSDAAANTLAEAYEKLTKGDAHG